MLFLKQSISFTFTNHKFANHLLEKLEQGFKFQVEAKSMLCKKTGKSRLQEDQEVMGMFYTSCILSHEKGPKSIPCRIKSLPKSILSREL